MALPQITLTGNLTADPELRFTAKQTALLKLRVACNERRKDDRGNWIDGRSTFLTVNVWGAKAENAANHLSKGQAVTVTGRLIVDKYQDKEGNERQSVEVDADSIALDLSRLPGQAAPATPDTDEEPF